MRIICSFVLAFAVSLGYAQSSLSKVDSRMMINVRQLQKQGWRTLPNEGTLKEQLSNLSSTLFEKDDYGFSKWIIKDGEASAQSDSIAFMLAEQDAKRKYSNNLVFVLDSVYHHVIAYGNNEKAITLCKDLKRLWMLSGHQPRTSISQLRFVCMMRIYRKLSNNMIECKAYYAYPKHQFIDFVQRIIDEEIDKSNYSEEVGVIKDRYIYPLLPDIIEAIGF
ncbi:MAG: hypothetical protein IJQ44_04095 [Bacteroidaceae bacterium]|nr:hypothetical protein [Bacteroidaceae bacterium]